MKFTNSDGPNVHSRVSPQKNKFDMAHLSRACTVKRKSNTTTTKHCKGIVKSKSFEDNGVPWRAFSTPKLKGFPEPSGMTLRIPMLRVGII